MAWLTKRKFWLRLLIAVSAFFMLLILGLYLGRERIAAYALDKVLEREFSPRNMDYSWETIEVKGVREFTFMGLQIRDSNQKTFLQLDLLETTFSTWDLIRKKPFLKSLNLEGVAINLNRLSPKKGLIPPPEKPGEPLISKLQRARKFLPENNRLKSLTISYTDSVGLSCFVIDSAQGNLSELLATVTLKTDSTSLRLSVKSQLDEGLHFVIHTLTGNDFPILYQRTGMSMHFDTLKLDVLPEKLGLLNTKVTLGIGFAELKVKHQKLSADTVQFNHLSILGNYTVTPRYFKLDSGNLNLNGLQGKVRFQLPLPGQKDVYALWASVPWQAANLFFSALPKGAFDDTRNLKASGKLNYELRFVLNEQDPENLVFDSKLNKKGFRILSFPNRPLDFFNDTFTHQVFDEGKFKRSLLLHPDAPHYTPLEEVNKDLIHAILCSEDPSFFQHRGFIMEAFRESILENYKERRFKRGASTLSMQLVKNLFLNRNKTIFRKLEEALIVWLIEDQHLSTKERMMEVYLNIIEWGPNVYGIGEASEYYFGKKPAALTLSESIYLANIIPRPKKYYWAFNPDGTMKDYMAKLGSFIARRMVKKEFLSPSDTAFFNPRITLTGKATERFESHPKIEEPIDSGEFGTLAIPID